MNRRWSFFSRAALVWEIPLALFSFLLFRVMRFGMRRMLIAYARRNQGAAATWQPLSAEILAKPLALAAIMTEGPRWNTHAIIAGVGPLQVQKSIGLHVAAAEGSATSWTVVIYTFPDQRTVASVGSLGCPFAAAWHELRLEPGWYSLALRYYHWSTNVELPAVTVDGVEVVQARTVPPDINHFYDDLSQRKSAFYLCLHYYVFTMLRLSAWLPQAFVEKNILPMGNPETQFYYGALWRGEALLLEIDQAILATRHVFLTLYTRDSFPLRWYEIHEARHITAPSQANVFYLVRVHQKASMPDSLADSSIRISVVRPDLLNPSHVAHELPG